MARPPSFILNLQARLSGIDAPKFFANLLAVKAGNFLKYFVLLVVAINVAVLLIAFFSGLKTKTSALPNPNGYDDFVNAGQSLIGDVSLYSDLNHEELGKLVLQNESAAKLLRTGPTRESRIPIDYER